MARKLLISLIVILHATHLSSCQSEPKTLCVHVADNASECSALTQMYNCIVCQPLSFYIQNISKYFIYNAKMMFTMGNHCLPPLPNGETVVNISGVSNFTMIGLGNVSYNPSEEGAVQPSSVITCSCSQRKSGILFYKSNTIHIVSLTIEDCGTKVVVPSNTRIDFTLVSALIFYDSYNIEVVRMRLNRNIGYGMIANRVFGNFTVSGSAFLRSVAYPVTLKRIKRYNPKYIGRNARFWYGRGDAHVPSTNKLLIEHSWFLYAGQNKKSKRIQSSVGLSIIITLPNVSVLINYVKAMHNAGGNVAIRISDQQDSTLSSSVTINNSIIAHGSAEEGGGLYIWIEINQQWHNGSIISVKSFLNVVAVLKTMFRNNSARKGGGAVFVSRFERNITSTIQRHISFKDCQFIGNSVTQSRSGDGAAVHIFKHQIADKTLSVVPLFSFYFKNCSFMYNKLNQEARDGGIVNFVLTSSIIIEDSNFTFNEGTAIFLQNSIVQFSGHTVFKNNSAMHGGALKFCQSSYMYMPVGPGHANIHIDFINNSATSTGGAIYVREQCAETAPLCFFQPAHQSIISFSDLNIITLRFTNNVARLAGDAIYGGQVDNCYTISYKKNVAHWSQKVFGRIFNLTQQNTSSQSTVSSHPYSSCFCNTSKADNNIIHTLLCKNLTYREVIPGQTISIGAVAVGQRNGIVPTTSVYFEFSNVQYESDNTTQLIINNGFEVNQPRTRCNVLRCTIYSNRMRAIFKLQLQQINPTEISYTDFKQPYLIISIRKCPWGFILSNSPPYKCDCDGLLTNHGIFCTIDTQTVTIPSRQHYWLGCSNSNQSDCRGLSLADHCLLGYCRTDTMSISQKTLDHQCSDSREGVLCGGCKKDHSLALGSSRCLQNCPEYLFYTILVVSAASGILVILFLIGCNFTVSEGTINGLFFYAHVVHRNTDSFFPGLAGTSNANVFRLFITWLNLDLGFEVCFYKSMTQYQKSWIQCGFIFYLCILEVAIIILSRKYIFFTRLIGRNVVKVLATLFLICCAKMMDIGISSLEFAHVKHSDGPNTLVWLLDGNISYRTGKHIPLFVLGSIFYSFALVYTMILLFIQCLQRRSNICCLRWVERWRPFFEAYTSPCRINYRFWPGFLFFIRLTLFTFGSVLRAKPTVNLHITTAACVVILIFAFVSPNGVYKRWPLNILEFSFLVNLGILSTLVATFCHSSGSHASSFVYPSVAIVMFLFVCIIMYHCVKRLMSYNCFQRFIQSVAARKAKFCGLMRLNVWKEIEQEEEEEPFLNE